MQEPHDREYLSHLRDPRVGLADRGGFLLSLFGGWRALVPLALALIVALVALAPDLTSTTPESRLPTPTIAAPRAGEAVQVGNPVALPRTPSETPPASREPAATPTPAGPTAVPTMPRPRDSAPAPVRKPGAPDPNPSTQHAVVVDGDSGAILFENNGFGPVAPASLTKIMTAILGIEHGDPSEPVKVDVDARSLSDSTVMGLEPWFDVTMEDLLYGLMLPSGNDAALAIGRHVAGDDGSFVRMMNEKAAWLGLRSSHFANPHGLDDPSHYSSPYDMVVMARYAMQYPLFRQLAAARRYDISRSNIAYTIQNLNPILWAYPGADGVKVGYTDEAGRSIVATASRNGHRVYVAFMRSSAGLVPDTTLLFDWAFNSFVWQ